MRAFAIAAVVATASVLGATPTAAEDRFPAPPGPHVGEAEHAEGFDRGQPVVGTYYFYWYDKETGEHFVNPDGSDALTRHPDVEEGISYREPSWHEGEFRDMLAAGIDFLLPVYWGTPADHESWSFAGLPPLVEACRRLEEEGLSPPRIGCFYDTSTLRHNDAGYHADLTTRRGREWLYATVRDFFSLIPAGLRATVEGRPVVWLYSAAFAKAQDPAALDHLRASFAEDFGAEPLIVKEVSWRGRADATYAWGGALAPRIHDVAAVGPGYDHSAVPGRSPLVREREGGRFYRRSWESVLRLPVAVRPSIAVVETWNEWHEGTDVAPSRESGRLYVELTREYADRWKRGEVFRPALREAERSEVSITLGRSNRPDGLVQNDEPDGASKPVERSGKTGRTTRATPHGGRYLYFDVDDGFYYGGGAPVTVEVEYLDEDGAPLRLEYDATDRSAPHAGAFKPAPEIDRRGTGEWRVVRFDLADPAFAGRTNGNDLRLVDTGGTLVVHRVAVRKREGERDGEATSTPGDRSPVLLNDDGAWCWFQDERAIVTGDTVIVGSVAAGRRDPGRRGSVEVVSWNLQNGSIRRATLHARLQRDDHAAPAFVLRADGRILSAYTKHGNDSAVRLRISKRPGDASTWRPERTVTPGTGSRITYSNLFRLSGEGDAEGRIYDFFRGHDDLFKPAWMTSDDGGETWSPRGLWIDFPHPRRHRPYVKYASNGRDRIHFVFTEGHPRVFDNSIYHAYFEDGAYHRSDGSRIGPVTDGPVTPGRSTRVFAGDAGNVAWTSDLHLDPDGRPVTVYSVQKEEPEGGSEGPGAGGDHRYRYARYTADGWQDAEIAYAGSRLYPGEDDYTGGVCLDPDRVDTVYFSTDVHPRTGEPDPHGHWQVWRGRTPDHGASWTFEPITRSRHADNLRPIVPRWRAGRTALLWLRGDYETYTRWDLEVVGTIRRAATQDGTGR